MPDSQENAQREVGIDLVNSEGLPTVRITRVAFVQGHQYYEISTERSGVMMRVTPKGYLRFGKVDHSRR